MQPNRHIPKKSFGQHFLKDVRVLKRIIEVSELTLSDMVLEIGPGKGALTKRLLATGARVVAVEKDADLIPVLSETFAAEIASQQLLLVHADVMDWIATQKILDDHAYKVVANIPYNITGALIEALLTAKCQPASMTLLIQKEVAERIVARDGKGSILAWSVHYFGTPKYCFTVAKQAFNPPPKVSSAVITVTNITHVQESLPEALFFQITRAAFAHKRKQLQKNLKAIIPEKVLHETWEALHLSPQIRAEDISWSTWLLLIRALLNS